MAGEARLLLPFPGFAECFRFCSITTRAGNQNPLQGPWGNVLLLLITAGHFKKNQMIKPGVLPGALT